MIGTLIPHRTFPGSGSSSRSTYSVISLVSWLNLDYWSRPCSSKTQTFSSSMRPLNFGVKITLGVHTFFFWWDPFPIVFFRASPISCLNLTRPGVGSPPVDPTSSDTEVASPLPILNVPDELMYPSVAVLSSWRLWLTCCHTLLVDTRLLPHSPCGVRDSLSIFNKFCWIYA